MSKRPNRPKSFGQEIKQTLHRSAFAILSKVHEDSFHGYPATSSAYKLGLAYLKSLTDKEKEIPSKSVLEEIVFRVFLDCGLVVANDIEHTVRGNASKAHPRNNRKKSYPAPKWSWTPSVERYLVALCNFHRDEIAREVRESMKSEEESAK